MTIDGLTEVNQLCDHRAGDDLLRGLGPPLASRASVDVTVARIDGNRFGILWTPAGEERPDRVVAPIVTDLQRAIGRWIDKRLALGIPSPVSPIPLVGVASGFDGQVWTQAELALDVTLADPTGPAITVFDPDDGRLAGQRRRHRVAGELARAVERERLGVSTGTVEPLGLDHAPGTRSLPGPWLRLGLRLPGAGRARDRLPPTLVSADDLASAPGLAAEIDRRLLDRAALLLNDELDRGDDRPTRVSVPLIGPLLGRRSALDDHRTWPPGVVVEVEQRHLAQLPVETGDELAQRLTDLGWELALTGFDGGLAGWTLAERLAVHHLVPCPALVVAGAAPETLQADILAATAAATAVADRWLIAPSLDRIDRPPSDDSLEKLGFQAVMRRPRS